MLRCLSRSKSLDPVSRSVHRSLSSNNSNSSSTLQRISHRYKSHATIRQPQRLLRQHHGRQRQADLTTLHRSSSTCTSSSYRTHLLYHHHNSHQTPPALFHTLQSRYFSNAAAATATVDEHPEHHEVNHVSSSTSTCNSTTNNNNNPSSNNPHKVSRRTISSQLRDWYWEHHELRTSDLREAVHVESLRNPKLSTDDIQHRNPKRVTCLWTATFTCPITKQVYSADPMEEEVDGNNSSSGDGGATDIVPTEEGPVFIDGRYYFTTKKAAVHAASALCMNDKTNDVTATTTIDSQSNLSTTSHFPDSTQNPRSQLQAKYRIHRVFPTSDNFQYIKHNFVGRSTAGGTWWTASFQCPVSLEWYGTIDLPQVAPELKMEYAGRWWYRQKPSAMHAASTSAMEAIHWDGLAKDVEERMELQGGHAQLVPRYVRGQKDAEFQANLQPIIYWYQQEHDMDIVDDEGGGALEDYFVTTKTSFAGKGTRWTASFLCPVTGERFDAGTLNDVSSERLDDTCWYINKNSAILAAALCAYDTLVFRKNGQTAPRFCKEDPSTLVDAIPIVDATNTINGRAAILTDDDGEDILRAEEAPHLSADFNEKMEEDDESGDEYDDVDDEEDDDYFLEVVPQQTTFVQDRRVSTLDVIAETWIESTRTAIAEAERDTKMDDTHYAVKQRQKAINRSMEWLAQQSKTVSQPTSSDRTQFDNSGEMSRLTIANAILSSLAEAHQHVRFTSEPAGVEDVAERILESMWSSNTYTPDGTSYASYLKCLEGETPETVAKRAKEIVEAMEIGTEVNGRLLPKPNSEVYTGLLQVLAHAGHRTLFQLQIINATLRLTRKMFLADMSAMAHNPSTFHFDVAMRYIDRMKELFEETADPSFEPDIEVFNAPLRWSGGGSWSRQYSRAVPWDSYSEIYSNGVVSEHAASVIPLHKQARAAENWLNHIQHQSELSPSIETIESVIQAWARCGTESGLYEAERLAQAVLNGEFSGVYPRLQTVYPIIAGWAYSGSEEGTRKLAAWMGTLLDSFKELETRRRFVVAPFLSQIGAQRQMLVPSDQYSITQAAQEKLMRNLTIAADRCSLQLDELVKDYKALPSFFLPLDVFMLTAQAWYNIASAAESLSDLEPCFEAIQETEMAFEDLVVWLSQNRTDETSAQLVHLLKEAPSLYGARLSIFGEYNRLSEAADATNDATKHLLVIEEKFRRSREFLRYLEDISDEQPDGKYDFGDSLALPSEPVLRSSLCHTWEDFLSQALSTLEGAANASTLQHPDVVRLCQAIADAVEMPVGFRRNMSESFSQLANNSNSSAGIDNMALIETFKLLKEALQEPREHGNRNHRQDPDETRSAGLYEQFLSDADEDKIVSTGVISELPVSVQNMIQDLRDNYCVEDDLDEGMLGMLKDLSEPVAIRLLQKFKTRVEENDVENKTAYLAGMLWRRARSPSKRNDNDTDGSRRPRTRIRRKKRGLSSKSKRRPRPHRSKMSES